MAMDNPFLQIYTTLEAVDKASAETLERIKNLESSRTAVADNPMTPEEAADFFNTTKVTIWAWEKKGIIKGYHLGNRKYFLKSELLAALTKRSQPA